MEYEPTIAFVVESHETPGLEIRVNFGVFAGRDATPAEIDALAAALLPEVGEVAIVAEERHEIGDHSEASVHQVRIEVDDQKLPSEEPAREDLKQRLLASAERWARSCIAERHAEVSEPG